MAISLITMSDGAPVTYLTHDVDYIVDGEGVDENNANRPMKNLAARDVVFRDKLNEIIAILNAAAGTAVDFAARFDVEHNPDGTHAGGSFHYPVTIPVGHTYLAITPGQELTATVDNPAVPTGGSGLLVASDDIRLAVDSGFAIVAAAGGDYTTPKAAIDAGENKILVTPGSYDDSGAGAIALGAPITMIGVGSVVWEQDDILISGGCEHTYIENITFDVGQISIFGTDHITIKRCGATNTPKVCLKIANTDYVLVQDFKASPVAGEDGIEISGLGGSNFIVIERYDCTDLRSAAGTPVNGIKIDDYCKNVYLHEIHAEFGAVGNMAAGQRGVYVQKAVDKFVVDTIYTELCSEAIYFTDLGVASTSYNDIWLRQVRYQDGGIVDVGVTSRPIRFEISGGSSSIRRLRIHDVHAQGASSSSAYNGVGISFVCTGAGLAMHDIEISDFLLHGESGSTHGIYFYVPNGQINRLFVNEGQILAVPVGIYITTLDLNVAMISHVAVIRTTGCEAVIIEDTSTSDLTITDLTATATAGNAFGFTYQDNANKASNSFTLENINITAHNSVNGIAIRIFLGGTATLEHLSASGGTVENGSVMSLQSNMDYGLTYGAISGFSCKSLNAAFAFLHGGIAYTSPTINITGITYGPVATVALANLGAGTPYNDGGSSFAHV